MEVNKPLPIHSVAIYKLSVCDIGDRWTEEQLKNETQPVHSVLEEVTFY